MTMESVGVLQSEIYYVPYKISLFGLLSTATKEDECHFCLVKIEQDDVLAMNTLCCDHSVHRDCFEMWKISSFYRTGNNDTYCAYCRSFFPESELCFLCLQLINETNMKISCCNSLLHKTCVQDLYHFCQILDDKPEYECGRCGCI